MKFFISHSSQNRDLVSLFVELLNSKLGVADSDIYCTSIQNQVKLGKNFIQDIQNNLVDAEVVFFLITEEYLSSIFCLMEMGAAWAYKENIIPILVPPVTFKTLSGTPLAPIQAYSLANTEDIGTILYDNLVECNAIRRLSRAKEQEFLLSLPDFVKRINECVADMSGRKQVESAQFVPVSQNGDNRAISLRQDGNVVDLDISFELDPLFGPCSFVSAVAQFVPPLNWKPLRATNAGLLLRFISDDASVTAASIEIKATNRMVKCYEKEYCLEHGQQDIIIKLSEIKYPSLINEIVEICIVVRPNQVPTHKGHLRIEVMGLHCE